MGLFDETTLQPMPAGEGCRQNREEDIMLKTFGVALLVVAMSVGLAEAKMMIKACADGQQAAATCACGTAANGKPLLCKKGQWCHSFTHTCGN
jgi:hypothetical protein